MINITVTWMVVMFYVSDAWPNNCFLRSSEIIYVRRERNNGTRALTAKLEQEGTWDRLLVFMQDILLWK